MKKTNELLAKLQAENMRDEALQQQMYQVCQTIAQRAIEHAKRMNQAAEDLQAKGSAAQKEDIDALIAVNQKYNAVLVEDITLLLTFYGAVRFETERIRECAVCNWITWDGEKIFERS